jgi:hypothetical protein
VIYIEGVRSHGRSCHGYRTVLVPYSLLQATSGTSPSATWHR